MEPKKTSNKKFKEGQAKLTALYATITDDKTRKLVSDIVELELRLASQSNY